MRVGAMNDSDVEEESRLAEYTDIRFMNQLAVTLNKDRKTRTRDTDNVSGSGSGSDTDNGGPFRKLSYNDVLKSLDQNDISYKYSNELDVIVSYLNSNKCAYKCAHRIILHLRNCILLPVVGISGVLSISVPFIIHFPWCGVFVSVGNAIVTILIIWMTFLKLETRARSVAITGERYDQLLMTLETFGSKLMFLNDDIEKAEHVTDKLKELEGKMSDIKMTSAELPGYLVSIFPIICKLNIFSFIKRVGTYKQGLVMKYRDVQNEYRFIKHNGGENVHDKKTRLRYLMDAKEKLKDEYRQYNMIYDLASKAFLQEVRRVEDRSWVWIVFFGDTPRDDPVSVINQFL